MRVNRPKKKILVIAKPVIVIKPYTFFLLGQHHIYFLILIHLTHLNFVLVDLLIDFALNTLFFIHLLLIILFTACNILLKLRNILIDCGIDTFVLF